MPLFDNVKLKGAAAELTSTVPNSCDGDSKARAAGATFSLAVPPQPAATTANAAQILCTAPPPHEDPNMSPKPGASVSPSPLGSLPLRGGGWRTPAALCQADELTCRESRVDGNRLNC